MFDRQIGGLRSKHQTERVCKSQDGLGFAGDSIWNARRRSSAFRISSRWSRTPSLSAADWASRHCGGTIGSLGFMITAIRVALGTASFAELFAVTFVEPVETHGVEDLPEGLPVRRTRMNVPSPVVLSSLNTIAIRFSPSCGRLVIDIASAT
jgi:hypothetical protein